MAALEKRRERKRKGGRVTLRVDVVVAKSRRKSRVNQAEGGKIRHKSWPRFFPRPAFTLDGVGHRLDLSASGSQEWILHIDHGPTLCALWIRSNSFQPRRGAAEDAGEEGGGRGCYLCGMARVTYTQGGITFIRQPVAPFRPKVNSRLTRNGDLSHPFSPFDFLKVESEFSPISKCMIRSFIIVPRFKIQFRFAQYNIHPILSRWIFFFLFFQII